MPFKAKAEMELFYNNNQSYRVYFVVLLSLINHFIRHVPIYYVKKGCVLCHYFYVYSFKGSRK